MHVRDLTGPDCERVVAVHEAAVREVVDRSATGDDPGGAASHRRVPGSYRRREVVGWDRDRDPGDYPVGDADRPTVVAVEEGTIVGFGGLDVEYGEIWAVYVHPDHAGGGVGTALLAHLEGRAVGRGVEALELLATLNAVEFYERAGYERVTETTVSRETGADQPVVEMAKTLHDGRPYEEWNRCQA